MIRCTCRISVPRSRFVLSVAAARYSSPWPNAENAGLNRMVARQKCCTMQHLILTTWTLNGLNLTVGRQSPVPDDAFEDHIRTTKEREDELTSRGIEWLVRRHRLQSRFPATEHSEKSADRYRA